LALLLAIWVALPGARFFPNTLHFPQKQAYPQLGWLWRSISQDGHLELALLDCHLQALEHLGPAQFPDLDRRTKGAGHLPFSSLLRCLANGLPLLHQCRDFVQPLSDHVCAQLGSGLWIRSQSQADLFAEELQVVQGLSRQTADHSQSSAEPQSEKQHGHGQRCRQPYRSCSFQPSLW
jgi:hypothetical protein